MNDKMFAELVESIKQAGQTRRASKMSASEGRALDWTKAQKVTFPDLKASTETISLRMPAKVHCDARNSSHATSHPSPIVALDATINVCHFV